MIHNHVLFRVMGISESLSEARGARQGKNPGWGTMQRKPPDDLCVEFACPPHGVMVETRTLVPGATVLTAVLPPSLICLRLFLFYSCLASKQALSLIDETCFCAFSETPNETLIWFGSIEIIVPFLCGSVKV